MAFVDAALRGGLVALLCFSIALLLRDDVKRTLSRVLAVFLAGLVVQVVASQPDLEASMSRLAQAPLVGVSVGNAVLFWLFVRALFDDEFALRTRHVIAWATVAGVSACNCASGFDGATVAGRLAIAVQRGAPLVFALLAVVAALSNWRADLVERRRGLRVFIVATGVLYTVGLLVARLASAGGHLSATTAVADVAALAAIVAVSTFAFVRVDAPDLLPREAVADPAAALVADLGIARLRAAAANDAPDRVPRASTDGPSIDDEADRLAAALDRTMRVERAYRTEGLTVQSLAGRLAVPEYRLRRLINHRLGHRNFNAFVNAFRLDDAREALADPARRGRPVLSIALDAGFQSIGPFNRAFKAATGQTPTAFRERHLTDS